MSINFAGLRFGLFQREPAIELELRLADGGFNAGNALSCERRVVTLGDESDLIFSDRQGGC